METYAQLFLSFINLWGYWAITILMGMENACIPIPSELILGFAGYLIFMGRLTFIGAFTAGLAGGLLGSVAAYMLGRYGGRSFVDHYGRYLFIKKQHIQLAEKWFDHYGLKAVLFSRMLPVVRTFISLPAGFAQVDVKKFFLCTFIGSAPWTIMLLGAGMLLGESWQIIITVGHAASLGFIGSFIVLAVLLYLKYQQVQK